jgi:hypothetical protein
MMILEELLLKAMYTLPSQKRIEFVITRWWKTTRHPG